MKVILLLFQLMFLVNVTAQNPCLTGSGGDFPGDEPPGCTLCNSVYSGSTIGFSADNEVYDFNCGTIENSQWISFLVNENGQVNFDLTSSGCEQGKGIEAALYDKDLNLIGNCVSAVTQTDSLNIFAENLEPGSLYRLMIDGVDGDHCNFRLSCFGCSFKTPKPILELLQDPPLEQVCKGFEICYSFAPVDFATHYQWHYTSDLLDPISGGGPNDTFFCAFVKDWGFGDVTVAPANGCRIGNAIFSNFTSFEIPTTRLTYFQCPGDSLPIDTCYTVGIGCDSCIVHNVVQASNGISVFVAGLCEGECFQINDSCYFEGGTHTVVFENGTSLGCDSIVRLFLDKRSIFDSPAITCESISSGIMVEWNRQSGADAYVVFVNRDSVATVLGDSYFVENIPFGTIVNIKIQPIGSCTYLPAEISCGSATSSTNQNFLIEKLKIFPNPTSGKINIKTDLKIEEIEIYNAAGRFLQKENSTSFDLKNRDTGIYFLKIKTNRGVGVKRILVN